MDRVMVKMEQQYCNFTVPCEVPTSECASESILRTFRDSHGVPLLRGDVLDNPLVALDLITVPDRESIIGSVRLRGMSMGLRNNEVVMRLTLAIRIESTYSDSSLLDAAHLKFVDLSTMYNHKENTRGLVAVCLMDHTPSVFQVA